MNSSLNLSATVSLTAINDLCSAIADRNVADRNKNETDAAKVEFDRRKNETDAAKVEIDRRKNEVDRLKNVADAAKIAADRRERAYVDPFTFFAGHSAPR